MNSISWKLNSEQNIWFNIVLFLNIFLNVLLGSLWSTMYTGKLAPMMVKKSNLKSAVRRKAFDIDSSNRIRGKKERGIDKWKTHRPFHLLFLCLENRTTRVVVESDLSRIAVWFSTLYFKICLTYILPGVSS